MAPLQVPFNLEYVTKLVDDERAKAPAASQGPQYKYNTEVWLLLLIRGLGIRACLAPTDVLVYVWCSGVHMAKAALAGMAKSLAEKRSPTFEL